MIKLVFRSIILLLVTVFTASAADRYWVGGTGNWSDATHWSAINGGAAGAPIPTSSDNVFFTSQSFTSQNQSVNLDVAAECLSMSWKGVLNRPSFNGNNSLSIYGSLKLDKYMDLNYTGDVYFKSVNTVGSTITSEGNVFKGNIFVETNGKLILNDALIATNDVSVTITKGEFNTNNKNLQLGAFIANGTNPINIELGKSILTIEKGWDVAQASDLNLKGEKSQILVGDNLKRSDLKLGANNLSYGIIKSKNPKPFALTVTLTQTANNLCPSDCIAQLTATVAGGTGPYSWEWFGPGVPASSTTASLTDIASNLCNGAFTIIVTDITTGEIVSDSRSIAAIAPIGFTFTPILPTCFGLSTGRLVATAGGGTTPYASYSWSNGVSGSVNNNIPAGNYCVTVTDANACTGSSCFTLTQPPALIGNGSSTNIACFGVCTGTIGVNPSGGTTPYTYSWTTGAATGGTQRTALCVGSYTVTIRDNRGCTVTYAPTLTQPSAALDGALTSQNPSCFGFSDGNISVSPSGGTPNYTYTWSNGANNVSSITSLPALGYTVTITDAASCTATKTVTLVQPTAIVPAPIVTDITCFGLADGTIDANVSGGTPSYNYTWSPGGVGGTTNGIRTGLSPGIYTVTVTDNNSCNVTATATVNEPAVLNANASGTNISCNGICDGTATAAPLGGTGSYTYSWSTTSIASNINLLCQGFYTVTVRDANACSSTSVVNITQPNLFTINATPTNISCNSLNDGAISTNTSGGTLPVTYVWSGSTATGSNRSGLSQGSYTVTATDAAGCTATASATITQPNLVTATTSVSPVSCNTGSNGTATVSPGGGTAPYSQIWSAPGGTNTTINGLSAGTYTVTVTDANACTATATAVINQPSALNINLTPTNIACAGSCTGAISSSVTGGTTPYVYAWSNSFSTTGISSVCVGGYTLTVTDFNGCTLTATNTVTAPTSLSATIAPTPVTCNLGCDGIATANPTGGTGAYTYTWSAPGTGQSINSLCQGVYTVTVTDAASCTFVTTTSITQPSAISPGSISGTASCTLCNGSATAAPSGGNPGYSYVWSSGGQTTNPAVGLCVGSYTVTIADASSCTVTGTALITPTVNITITTSASVLSCNGACDGIATANATGGVLPYTYAWSSGITSTTLNATGLCAATYTVTVTDAGSCFTTATLTFINPPLLGVTITSTNATCNGVPDGTVTANPTGGTGAYTFSWSNNSTATGQTGLAAGGYTVTVTDNNGCSTTANVTLTEPGTILANASVTTATCGLCDGVISLAPTGGSGVYTYAWSNSATTASSQTGLCLGSYTVSISDGGACTYQFTNLISNLTGPVLTKTKSNATCNGICNGTADATATGTAPIIYAWSTLETTPGVTGLCAGIYSVTVTDGINCATIDTFLITAPPIISPTIIPVDVSCGGSADGAISVSTTGGVGPYNYAWTPAAATSVLTGLTPGTYSLTITDANLCTYTANIPIAEPPVLAVSSLITTDLNCKGVCDGAGFVSATGGVPLPGPTYTYAWSSGGPIVSILSSAINLCPATYTVTITDANGCSTTSSATITEPAVALSVGVTKTDVICNGACDGTATANAAGGTAGYVYNWVPSSQTTVTTTTLCAGPYAVTVTDGNGCTVTDAVTITEPALITFTFTQNNVTCNGNNDGSVTLSATGGTGVITYSWSSGQTTGNISSLSPGAYVCTATDASGCSNTQNINITEPGILLPNATGTDPNCSGPNTGSVVTAVAGGTSPFVYSWSSSPTDLSSSITNQPIGTYIVRVTDNNGCVAFQTVTLNPPTPITILDATADANCSVCNGTIDITPSGGTAPFNYTWSNSLPAVSGQTGLCAATYSLTVSDVNGCTATTVLAVNNTGGPTGETVVAADATCNALCDGAATVTPIGGTGPYNYSWTYSGAPAATNVATGMCAGSYFLQVTDANGCIRNSPVTIGEPTPFVFTAAITDISCSGKCDGGVVISTTGGTSPYNYVWNNGNTGATQTNLCAAIYTVTLTDASLCTATTTITVGTLTVLVPTITTTNLTCNAVCTGTSAVANVTGSTGALTYTWTTGSTAQTVSGLCALPYTVTITDNIGCNISQVVTPTEPAVLTVIPATTLATCGACNGVVSAAVSGGVSPYNFTWGTGSTAQTINSACAGIYALQVSDFNGCSQTFNVPLNNNGGPTGSTKTKTNETCFGTADGTASVAPIGGASPYDYLWITPVTGGSSSSVNGLTQGIKTIQIRDANNCIYTDTLLITGPSQIVLNETVTDATCGISDGQIQLAPTGGVAGYGYVWSSAETTALITLKPAGLYTVTVTDASACTTTSIISISNANAPILSATITNISCGTSCTGSATITASGGTAPYVITWLSTGATGATSITANALCVGAYQVQVTDALGCLSITTVNITEPLKLVMSLPGSQQATCSAACNGKAKALPLGGTLPYAYSWSTNATTDSIVGLCPNTYTVTVTDFNNCTVTQTITITPNPAPFNATSSVTNATCGLCDGQININVSGGTTPYNYIWSNGNSGATATNLCAAVYQVTATDNVGCSQSFFIPVSNPGAPTSSGKAITNITCFGQATGAVTLTPVGGTAPYSYLWLPTNQTGSSVNNLTAGLSFVQIKDANGCILTDSVSISEPSQIDINPTIVVPSACAVNDGSITLNPSGGITPYGYLWSNGAIVNTRTNLGGGLYGVTVTDAVGCAISTVVKLDDTSAPSLTATATDETCATKCDGTATATAVGGAGAYVYSWFSGGQTSSTITAQCAGDYYVQVTDGAGCVVGSSATISSPLPLVSNFPNSVKEKCVSSCDGSISVIPGGGSFPYAYAWNGTTSTSATATGLCKATYTITITDAASCSIVQVDSVLSPAPLITTTIPVDANCSNTQDGAAAITVTGGTGVLGYNWTGPLGYTSNAQNITGLAAGKYYVTVNDANGCLKVDSALVNATIAIVAKAGNDTILCSGSTLTLDGSNSLSALSYEWFSLPSVSSIATTATVNINPTSGSNSYMLVATNGVCSDADTIVVNVNTAPVVDAGNPSTIVTLQDITLGGSPTGPVGATYLWKPLLDNPDSLSANPVVAPLLSTSYTVIVKDVNGCTASDTVRITVLPEIIFNNGLTPNGDGRNDVWMIDNIQKFPKCLVEVYNRWGELLFTSVGYNIPWDGKYNGGDLPVGTYYYVIKLNDPLFPDAFTGPITIIR